MRLPMLTAVGVQAEAQLPFAASQQLLRPMQDRIPELPTVHQEALLSAFGLLDDLRPTPFLIALAPPICSRPPPADL
jgi:hypothetical protein